MFWGALSWRENGTGYRLQNLNEPIYVISPTKAINIAWIKLVKNRYFNVTEEEEAEWTFGKPHGLYNHLHEGFRIGLDVLLALHCVDMVRRALDKDCFQSYNETAVPGKGASRSLRGSYQAVCKVLCGCHANFWWARCSRGQLQLVNLLTESKWFGMKDLKQALFSQMSSTTAVSVEPHGLKVLTVRAYRLV